MNTVWSVFWLFPTRSRRSALSRMDSSGVDCGGQSGESVHWRRFHRLLEHSFKMMSATIPKSLFTFDWKAVEGRSEVTPSTPAFSAGGGGKRGSSGLLLFSPGKSGGGGGLGCLSFMFSAGGGDNKGGLDCTTLLLLSAGGGGERGFRLSLFVSAGGEGGGSRWSVWLS